MSNNRQDRILKSQTRALWVYTGITFITVILATISLIYSIKSYKISKSETMYMSVKRVKDNYDTYYSRIYSNDKNGTEKITEVSLKTLWECDILNTSSVILTVSNCAVKKDIDEPDNRIRFSNMYVQKPEKFPLVIKPGEKKTFRFEYYLPISQRAYEILEKHFMIEKPKGIKDYIRAVWMQGIDLLGNNVMTNVDHGRIVQYERTSNSKSRGDFYLVAYTEKGNKFNAYGCWLFEIGFEDLVGPINIK